MVEKYDFSNEGMLKFYQGTPGKEEIKSYEEQRRIYVENFERFFLLNEKLTDLYLKKYYDYGQISVIEKVLEEQEKSLIEKYQNSLEKDMKAVNKLLDSVRYN